MKLGIIGRGPWGDTYAETLRRMGVEFWQAGRDWRSMEACDGVIIASAADSHYRLAFNLISDGMPVLIEKPICLYAAEARSLHELADDYCGIVFAGHTRLYAPSWRAFKAKAIARGIKSVSATAGSPCKLDPLWDWGPHLVAMCLDLGFDPALAKIETGQDNHPLTLVVNNDLAYIDRPAETPRPLEVLLVEFMDAIDAGETDIRGLELGVKVIEALKKIEARQRVMV